MSVTGARKQGLANDAQLCLGVAQGDSRLGHLSRARGARMRIKKHRAVDTNLNAMESRVCGAHL